MIKTLVSIGDGLGIVLDDALLKQLGIDQDSQLDVSTDGQALVIRPVPEAPGPDRRARIQEAADRVMDIHDATLRKLAL
jgi:antitoxin component of MazEF toxin-antitoxin module